MASSRRSSFCHVNVLEALEHDSAALFPFAHDTTTNALERRARQLLGSNQLVQYLKSYVQLTDRP